MIRSSASIDKGQQGLDAPIVTALGALAWIAGQPEKLERMMKLTGLNPDLLRDRADDPALLAAVLGFLESHEPDLIACAEATGHEPDELVMARERLER